MAVTTRSTMSLHVSLRNQPKRTILASDGTEIGGDCDLTVDGRDGMVDGSDIGKSIRDLGSRTDERMETDEAAETEEAVRLRCRLGTAKLDLEDTGVGEGTLGGNDALDGVGVSDEEAEDRVAPVLTSVIGVSVEEGTELVGRRNDVSNDASTPSGNASDCTEGDALSSDDSYDPSDSAAHIDSGTEGLGGIGERRSVEGTVGVSRLDDVGVTEDSVGEEMLDMEGRLRGTDGGG